MMAEKPSLCADAGLEMVEAACRGRGVAVLIPCYNEALTVGKVVDDFKESVFQIQ